MTQELEEALGIMDTVGCWERHVELFVYQQFVLSTCSGQMCEGCYGADYYSWKFVCRRMKKICCKLIIFFGKSAEISLYQASGTVYVSLPRFVCKTDCAVQTRPGREIPGERKRDIRHIFRLGPPPPPLQSVSKTHLADR